MKKELKRPKWYPSHNCRADFVQCTSMYLFFKNYRFNLFYKMIFLKLDSFADASTRNSGILNVIFILVKVNSF